MKKGEYRFLEVEIPLYFGTLRVVIADDLQAANDALDYGESTIAGGLGCYSAVCWDELPNEKHAGYITTAMFRGIPEARTMAHEGKHLVNRLFRSRGVQLDVYNDEPECYMLGWFVKQIDQCAHSKEIKAQKYPKK